MSETIMPTPKPIILAQLMDGTYKVLEKDCSCLDKIHVGPHWLHMNELDAAEHAKRHAAVREVFTSWLVFEDKTISTPRDEPWLWHALMSLTAAEVRRLKEKREQMERAGIAKIYRGKEALAYKACFIDQDFKEWRRLTGRSKED